MYTSAMYTYALYTTMNELVVMYSSQRDLRTRGCLRSWITLNGKGVFCVWAHYDVYSH